MSDKPIAVGDFVRVAKTCCPTIYEHIGGKIGIVKEFDRVSWRCKYCGTSGREAKAVAFHLPYECAPVSWLKRIDPPALDEDVPEKEELTV